MNLTKEAEKLRDSIIDATDKEITEADRTMIHQYCWEFDLYNTACERLGDGFENKHGQVSPALTARNQAIGNMIKIYKQIKILMEPGKAKEVMSEYDKLRAVK